MIHTENITAQISVSADIEKVWNYWTKPEHIVKWNLPFDGWRCPKAENDIAPGGLFNFRMESLDRKEGFDFKGTYDKIVPFEYIESTQDDGRRSVIVFSRTDNCTVVCETFEPEERTDIILQEKFCQSVLNRFKTYTEKH
ncbi:SRPBCC domain-containing protein [Arachidicoccus sp.]|uniref:SRPBCC domain-containing protein n=1 Tax=Arachidicoccus sp. TaxID=1872624 RepID=UPI003D25E1B2